MKELTKNIILNKILYILILIVPVLSLKVQAQDSLTYDNFIDLVKIYHPTAKRAKLQSQKGELIVKDARGNFDPVLKSKYKEKYFQSTHYYLLFDAELYIPTASPINIKVGHFNNGGTFLNPENFNPSKGEFVRNGKSTRGASYIGVEIPLGSGLLTDKSRTGLKVAKELQKQKLATADLTRNDLLLSAAQAYWDWYQYHKIAENLNAATQVSLNRLEYVKKEFFAGESAALDTLKAFVLWQNRNQDHLDAKRKAISSFYQLNIFLWDQELVLKQELIPQNNIDQNNTVNLTPNISDQHPSLRYYLSKNAEEIVKVKLKKEKLRPKLDLELNLLTEGLLPESSDFGANHSAGLKFYYPLFTRSARSQVKLANIKVQESLLKYDLKRRQLNNKLADQIKQHDILTDQISIMQETINAYEQLISSERIKFSIGESSLFELNNWEQQMINNQNKLVKRQSKLAKNRAKIQWTRYDW